MTVERISTGNRGVRDVLIVMSTQLKEGKMIWFY